MIPDKRTNLAMDTKLTDELKAYGPFLQSLGNFLKKGTDLLHTSKMDSVLADVVNYAGKKAVLNKAENVKNSI